MEFETDQIIKSYVRHVDPEHLDEDLAISNCNYCILTGVITINDLKKEMDIGYKSTGKKGSSGEMAKT